MAFVLNKTRARRPKSGRSGQGDQIDEVRLNFGLVPGPPVVRFVKKQGASTLEKGESKADTADGAAPVE